MKKRILAITSAIVLLCALVSCGNGNNASSTVSVAESSTAESSMLESTEPESSPAAASGAESSQETDIPKELATARVAALKGPTAMGMVEMMDKEYGTQLYDFTLAASPDEISPLVIQGKVDIAAVPANLASVLYNKTEGKIQVISINTLGVLYIVENGDVTVKSVADLKGKTIFASGKGATPEYALNYMLTQNGIDPETDVTIEYKSEHAECVTALAAAENAVAMLPQPFVTTAMTKNENIKIALDMTEEWEKLATDAGTPATLVTGVTIATTEFIEANPEAVKFFLQEQSASSKAVNDDPAAASVLMEKFDIVPAAVAEKAIPNCNITCIPGTEMKEALSSYLSVLHEQNPQAVGGTLPDDAFYYLDN